MPRRVDEVASAIADGFMQTDSPFVLAVSGGIDSMALLHAAAAVAHERIACVATFDHGTGIFARKAAAHVRREAARLGLRFVGGSANEAIDPRDGMEAGWRQARFQFLGGLAREVKGCIVTAHTEDDQVETVLMRIMRGSGARGLAGLAARQGNVFRPLLRVRRSAIERFVLSRRISFLEDPSNASRSHFRNRIRMDILPALRRARPDIDRDLLEIAANATALRITIDRVASLALPCELEGEDRLIVSRTKLPQLDADSLVVLWTSAVARAGCVLDRRGMRRLAAFVETNPRAGIIPLAGGWTLRARNDDYIVERCPAAFFPAPAALPASGSMRWGRFQFRVADGGVADSLWSAALPADGAVRAWVGGDRLEPSRGQPSRRVARYLSDARVTGHDRRGWPVVVTGDDVVWIPGVRRSDAATERSGRPVRHYVCERIDR